MNDRPGPIVPQTRATSLTPWAIVFLAAVLPYAATIDDYFVRDDFGVVQLLAQKPFSYFPKWFASSWMDEIWAYVPDEVRPFPALSYQLTSLGGPVSPILHHALNILIHAANGLLVMAIARRAAALGVRAATFAGARLRAASRSYRERRLDHWTRRLDAGPLLSGVVSRLRVFPATGITSSVRLVARPLLRRAVHQAEHDHDGGHARRL